MTIGDAEHMFQWHLERFISRGLIPKSGHRWKIQWKREGPAPEANVFRRLITLDPDVIHDLTESQFRRMIRHQLAHAVTWHEYQCCGHVREFNEVCIELMINPEPLDCMVGQPRIY